MLNEQLLKRLNSLKEDGVIEVQGRVVIRGGKVMLQLDQLNHFSTTPNSSSEIENTFPIGKYKVYLREESLSEIPVIRDE